MISREIEIMIRCQHPTIIKFKGFSIKDFLGEKNVTILMERANKGSLSEFLKKIRNNSLDCFYDNTNKQILLIGIARGMMYLHQRQVIHRDLKSSNILLDDNLFPLITDFGLSKFYGLDFSMSQSQQCGTAIYMAPEIIEGFQYNGKVDVYSFRILMYEIVTDLIPFPDLENKKMTLFQFYNNVVNMDYRPKFNDKTSVKDSIMKLIMKCWAKNPKERPTFEELYSKLAFNIEDPLGEDTSQMESNKYYLDYVEKKEIITYLDYINQIDSAQNDENSFKYKELFKNLKVQSNQLNKKPQTEIKPMKSFTQSSQKREKIIEEESFTIEKFNKLSIRSQEKIASRFKNEGNLFFSKIDDFLRFQLNSSPNETDSFFSIEKKMNDYKICILWRTIELVNASKPFSLNNFIRVLSQFDDILVEFRYPSPKFNCYYRFTSELKEKLKNKVKFLITISGTKRMDHYFMGNTLINYFKFDSSVNGIGSRAFYKCSSLEQISIPISVSSIEKEAFSECSSLTSVTILSSFISIGDYAFCNCQSLTKISIPSFIRSFGIGVFYGCIKLNQIEIRNNPKGEENIKYFDNKFLIWKSKRTCSNYDVLLFTNPNLNKVTIPSLIKILGGACLNRDLTQITIPSSVTQIGIGCFSGCSSLTQIIIPPSVIHIGESAFCGCKSLKQVLMSSSVKSLENSIFCYCSSLTQIKIPPSVNSIGNYSFCKCFALKQVTISSSVTQIGLNSFDECTSLVQVLFTIPSSLTQIGGFAFHKCSSLKQFSIPASVTQIESGAFDGCSSLQQILIPSSVKQIDNAAFCDCSSLANVSFKTPSSLTHIGVSAFHGCLSLTQIIIPSSVIEIGKKPFSNCLSLKQISIPRSLNTSSNMKHFNFDINTKVEVIIR